MESPTLFVYLLLWSYSSVIMTEGSCMPPTYTKNQDNLQLLRDANSITFKAVTPKSKFLSPTNWTFKTNPASATKLCFQVGLEPAVIGNLEEFHHLRMYYYGSDELINASHTGFNLGLKKGINNTYFIIDKDNVNDVPMKFQVFGFWQGAYLQNGYDCVALHCGNAGIMACFMHVTKCGEMGSQDELRFGAGMIPLCQWTKEQKNCHNLTEPSAAELEELMFLGTSIRRTYWGAKFQLPFDEAELFCEKNYMRVTNFEWNDRREISQLFEVMSHYSRNFIHPMGNIFNGGHAWTAFKYFEGGFNKSAKFESVATADEWKYEDSRGQFSWFPASKMVIPLEEACLLVTKLDEREVRPVLCNMPQFFMCFQEGMAPTPPRQVPLPFPARFIYTGRPVIRT